MCFTRIYGFIFCDPKVINSSLETAVFYDPNYSLNSVGVYCGSYDDRTYQGLEYHIGTNINGRYRWQQESNGLIGLFRRKSDDSSWDILYRENINDITTIKDSINVLKDVGGSTASAAIPAGGTVMTTIKTFTLPSTASLYLVMAYANVNVATSGWMQMELEGSMVRSISDNGGGMINFVALAGGHSVTIKGFVSSSVNNATMTVTWNYFPLY